MAGLEPWVTAGPCPRPPRGWLHPWGAAVCRGSGRSCRLLSISPAEKGEWPGSVAGCGCPRPHCRTTVPWGCFEPPLKLFGMPRRHLRARPDASACMGIWAHAPCCQVPVAPNASVGKRKRVPALGGLPQSTAGGTDGQGGHVPHPSWALSGDVAGGTDKGYPPLLRMLLCTPKTSRMAPYTPQKAPKRQQSQV